jgi:hypothetical protein
MCLLGDISLFMSNDCKRLNADIRLGTETSSALTKHLYDGSRFLRSIAGFLSAFHPIAHQVWQFAIDAGVIGLLPHSRNGASSHINRGSSLGNGVERSVIDRLGQWNSPVVGWQQRSKL